MKTPGPYFRRLESLGPLLRAVVDGENYDAVIINISGVGCDEGSIGNDQFTSAWNPARSARHGKSCELLNTHYDLHHDPGGKLFAVRKSDVIVDVIELPGGLLGPFDC